VLAKILFSLLSVPFEFHSTGFPYLRKPNLLVYHCLGPLDRFRSIIPGPEPGDDE
jgi:hypothetical protein